MGMASRQMADGLPKPPQSPSKGEPALVRASPGEADSTWSLTQVPQPALSTRGQNACWGHRLFAVLSAL